MSGETEEQVSGWTVDTLHRYIRELIDERDTRYEQRFTAQEKAVKDALTAADRAVTKAELATEKRLEGVNEFRATLTDYTTNLMPRGEVTALLAGFDEKLTALQSRIDRSEGKGKGIDQAWGYLVGLVGVVAAAVAVIVAVTR